MVEDLKTQSRGLAKLEKQWKQHNVPACPDIFAQPLPESPGLLKVLKGAIRITSGKALFMLLEEGDYIDPTLIEARESITFGSDLAVQLGFISKSQLKSLFQADPAMEDVWAKMLALQTRLFFEISAALTKNSSDNFEPDFSTAEAGETIIEQGSLSSEVYTLVEGQAEVYVNGTLVGSIQPNQIFGALAAFCSTPRSATVKAKTDCSYMCLPERDFISLMRARPETVLSLCRDMALTIQNLNLKVVELTKKNQTAMT